MDGLIKQRGLYDCGIACVAMAARMTYDEAFDLVGRDPNVEVPEFDGQKYAGVTPDEISWALFRVGVLHHFMAVAECWPDECWQRVWGPYLNVIRTHDLAEMALACDSKYRAILGVESRNAAAGHWIYVDNGIYDPSTRLTYGDGDVIPVQCAFLMRSYE